MKTITLTEPHTFADALAKLTNGECLGIKPGNNTRFVVAFRPHWMNPESPDFMLCWEDSDPRSPNMGIRSDQYLEKWFLVVADHRVFRASGRPNDQTTT